MGATSMTYEDVQKKRAPAGASPANIGVSLPNIPTNNQPDAYSAAISQPVTLEPLKKVANSIADGMGSLLPSGGGAQQVSMPSMPSLPAWMQPGAGANQVNIQRPDWLRAGGGAQPAFGGQQVATPEISVNPPAAAQSIASQAAPAQAPSPAAVQPAAVQAKAPVQQPAAVQAPPVQQQQPAMPRSIGDVAQGTGVVRNNATGKTTNIGSPTAAAPTAATPATRQVAYDFGSPAENARDFSIGEQQRMLRMDGGGLGAAVAANMMGKHAKNMGGIAAEQKNADTSRMNAETQARHAADQQAEVKRKADRENKINGMRDELAGLDDKNDADGKKRSALKSKLEAMTGVDKDKYQAVLGKDEMGNSKVIGILDSHSGKMTDMSGNPIQQQPQYTVGQVYQDASGNKAKWDGTKFVSM